MLYNNLRRKLMLGFGLGVAVFVVLILYADVRETRRLLQNFQWSLVPAILSLTTLNYILRSVRFHYYLRQIGIKDISFWTSLRIFIGGFALTLTPGKLGELIRILWLKRLVKANPAKTAPLMLADRISDGLAMTLLASLGVFVHPQYWPAVALILVILLAGVLISQIRPLALWCLNFGERLPLVAKVAHHLHTLYESTYELLRFKNLVIGVGIGLISWAAEGVAFYLVLIGLGSNGSFDLAALAIFILALGSILGGASTLPGGLGAAEASMTGMLQALVNLPENMAATATLLVRFCTLWFGVMLGCLIIVIWRRMLFSEEDFQVGGALVSTIGVKHDLSASEGGELAKEKLIYE